MFEFLNSTIFVQQTNQSKGKKKESPKRTNFFHPRFRNMEVFNHSLWLLVSYQNLGFFVYGISLFAKEKRNAELFFSLCCFFIGVDIFLFHLLFFSHHQALSQVIPLLTATVFLPVPFYFLFLKADSDHDFRFRPIDGFHFLPFFVGLTVLFVLYINDLHRLPVIFNSHYISIFILLQWVFYYIKIIRLIPKTQQTSPERQRNYLMTLFSVNAFFVMMVLLLGREFFLISESLHISSLYLLLVVILNLIVVFHAFRYKKKQIETQLNTVNNPEYEFEIKDKYISSPIHDDTKKALIAGLEKYFSEKEPYLNSKLCVDDVARELGTNNKYLSQTINEHYGKNFTSFVNGFRCQRVIEYFGMEEYENFSLDGIAESAGFQSRSTFVAAFKKHTGQLPSVYRSELKRKTKEA